MRRILVLSFSAALTFVAVSCGKQSATPKTAGEGNSTPKPVLKKSADDSFEKKAEAVSPKALPVADQNNAASEKEGKAQQAGAGEYAGSYVGTFFPKCGSCHAKATITSLRNNYVLKVEVDYTPMKDRCQETVRRFEMTGEQKGNELVFADKKYSVKVVDGRILGERNVGQVKMLDMKRDLAAPPAKNE